VLYQMLRRQYAACARHEPFYLNICSGNSATFRGTASRPVCFLFGSTVWRRKMNTIRKTIAGALALAAVGILSPSMASARMGGGFGGGFHGGGFHGGGFRGGGWGGAGLAAGAIGLGLGIAAAPYAYGGYGYGYPYYGGYDSYAYDGGCYMVRRWTPWGPRLVQVCN
jgi:hypothetical protein